MARRSLTRAVAHAASGSGLRVAIYIRRSTDEEHQPFSLEAQEAKLRAYINSQPGWSLVAVYPDDASGAKLDRPGLDKALAAARAGRFDVLLVYRVDRFTRRIRDLVTLLDELDTAGVAFRSATEPFDTSTPAGRMLVQMLGVFAEFEREMIIDRVINGMERKAAKGKWTLGVAPYGYTLNPEHILIPNPAEAAVVVEIFRLYTRRRLGTRATATVLNKRGLRRRSGRPWSHKTVGDVLTNRVYLGEIHFRDVISDSAHQAIIDPKTFQIADRILTQRGENPAIKATAASDYHLTGKITCPACGRHYLGTSAVGRSRTYRYYTCFTRSRYGVEHCAAPRLDADALDQTTLDALRDFYTHRYDLVAEAIAAARAEHTAARAAHQAEVATITGQLAAKEAVVDRYLTDYETDKIDRDTVAGRIEKLSAEIRQLRHRRDELTFTLDTEPAEPADAIHTTIRDHVDRIIDTGGSPERKALCEALIVEIRLNHDNTATPVFRIPLSSHDASAILDTQPGTATKQKTAVRERPPPVPPVGLEPTLRPF